MKDDLHTHVNFEVYGWSIKRLINYYIKYFGSVI